MNIGKSLDASVNIFPGHSEPDPVPDPSASNRVKLGQAAEMMHGFRQAQSLAQLIQALTQTLPIIMEACGCGYLTWVQSPGMGVRWESVTGDMGKLMEQTAWGVDPATSTILKSGKFTVFSLPDPEVPSGIATLMQRTSCSSLLILPIYLEGDVRGILVLGRKPDKQPWAPDEAVAGYEMVELAVTVYGMRNDLAQAQQQIRELERVFLASLDLTATLDPEDVLNNILKNALALITNANDAHIFYYDGEHLSFGAALFQDGSSGEVWSVPRNEGLTYTVARTGKMIVVENMGTHHLYKDAPASWRGAIIGLPLKMKGEVIGVMTLALLDPYTFNEMNVRQLRLLADQAGIAIQNARLHNLIREEAQTDWLTGLPNRRAFELTIVQLIDQGRTLGRSFTLMMLDLDHFKSINDTYGHRVGDEALKRIALRLKESVRKTDFLTRLGGDEFAILFPNTSLEEAYTIGIGLQQHVSGCDLKLPDGKLGCVSVSLGLANFPQSGLTPEDLLEAADSGLYADKDQG